MVSIIVVDNIDNQLNTFPTSTTCPINGTQYSLNCVAYFSLYKLLIIAIAYLHGGLSQVVGYIPFYHDLNTLFYPPPFKNLVIILVLENFVNHALVILTLGLVNM